MVRRASLVDPSRRRPAVDDRPVVAVWSQRALGEFPEKELQLHQTETWGQKVLDHTAQEGHADIRRDLKRLRESWMALYDLSLNLNRYGTGSRGRGELANQKGRPWAVQIQFNFICIALNHRYSLKGLNRSIIYDTPLYPGPEKGKKKLP